MYKRALSLTGSILSLMVFLSISPAAALSLPELVSDETVPVNYFNTLIQQQGTGITFLYILILFSLLINIGFLFSIWTMENSTQQLLERMSKVSSSFEKLSNIMEEKEFFGVNKEHLESLSLLKEDDDEEDYIETVKTFPV
ncbi:MAG: hypothetical protein M1269_02350 [Chloroflexi bacterium]|nr:hypothetical protein [Chloroflexota bacterium]